MIKILKNTTMSKKNVWIIFTKYTEILFLRIFQKNVELNLRNSEKYF